MIRAIALALLAAPLLTSCYKVTYHTGQPSEPTASFDEWHHIALFGLIEISDPVPLNQLCPTGFSEVHNEVTFLNGLVPMCIPGVGSSLYSPHTVRVKCTSGQSWRLETNEQGLVVQAQYLGQE